MKTVVLGITGGIAAFKILELIPLLQQQGITIEVMMTYGATKMVDPQAIEKLIGRPVYRDIFADDIEYQQILTSRKVDHIELVKKADLIVIAPATANSIAKLAVGIADDYLTTAVLAARSPILICPSMNAVMWKNPVTQENVFRLQSRGFLFLQPEAGLLACGETGEGRLVSLDIIVNEIVSLLQKRTGMKKRKIIVTAGGTREYIDDVRFITNKSSGKMGIAIAESAFARGADVLILRAKSSVAPRFPLKEKLFETAEELKLLLQQEAQSYDICFHAAAVSDYGVKEAYHGKLSSKESITLTLLPREKILRKIKEYNPHIFLIAFKAAWDVSEEQLLALAKETLQQSHADVVIANDVGKKDRGFDVDTNEVYLITQQGKQEKISLASKKLIAENILDALENII